MNTHLFNFFFFLGRDFGIVLMYVSILMIEDGNSITLIKVVCDEFVYQFKSPMNSYKLAGPNRLKKEDSKRSSKFINTYKILERANLCFVSGSCILLSQYIFWG